MNPALWWQQLGLVMAGGALGPAHPARLMASQAASWAAASVARVRSASCRAAAAKSSPEEAYRMAREELTMIGPPARSPAR